MRKRFRNRNRNFENCENVFEIVIEFRKQHYSLATARLSHSRRGDCPEPLLSGRVPNLQLHAVIADREGFDFEVHPDGGKVRAWELVARITHQEAALACPWKGIEREIKNTSPEGKQRDFKRARQRR